MELLEQFVHGNLDAFEALFRQFQREVYGWILRIVRDPAARLPFGFYGLLFFVVFGPLGYFLAGLVLDLSFLPSGFLGVVIPAGLLVYYLLWKYLVSYFNRVLGLA